MKTKSQIIALGIFSLTIAGCGKECKTVSVDTTGPTAHTHSSETIFEAAQTYSSALVGATAGNAHTHDITLTDSHVTGMASAPIDVTSSTTDSHTHTARIECGTSMFWE